VCMQAKALQHLLHCIEQRISGRLRCRALCKFVCAIDSLVQTFFPAVPTERPSASALWKATNVLVGMVMSPATTAQLVSRSTNAQPRRQICIQTAPANAVPVMTVQAQPTTSKPSFLNLCQECIACCKPCMPRVCVLCTSNTCQACQLFCTK